MASWLLRDAVARDLPAIVAIYNATIPGRMVTADITPVAVEDRLPWFQRHSPGRRPLWVVDDDGAIAGWLSFESFRDRAAYAPTCEISLYVAERERRKGIGTFLLAEAIRQSPRFGVKTLVGYVFSHNTPSLRLFAALGFEEWGRYPDVAELDGIPRSVTVVGRRVGPNDGSA